MVGLGTGSTDEMGAKGLSSAEKSEGGSKSDGDERDETCANSDAKFRGTNEGELCSETSRDDVARGLGVGESSVDAKGDGEPSRGDDVGVKATRDTTESEGVRRASISSWSESREKLLARLLCAALGLSIGVKKSLSDDADAARNSARRFRAGFDRRS